ncbi:MAG TPA: mechanosensitive ion channel family protein [Rhodanobacteraceae bacterium]|nr:mechanosensitive ion channel family protein [Rhodanobacteraceae bacterium]
MHDWLLHGQWLGNSALAWVIAGVCALAGYLVAHSAALFLRSRLNRLATRTHRVGLHVAAGVAGATRGWLLLLIAIAVALDFLRFPKPFPHWHEQLTFVLIGIQVAFWVVALLIGWLDRTTAGDNARNPNPVMVGVLRWAVQFAIWVTLLLAILANSGVQITAFVASLGVGGVAVALALQNVLTDLFSSIAIGLDKPFVVGEFIAFGSDLGTVTRVGIKSTRIQSLSGEELAISNSALLKNLIHNYSRMRERRVVFHFRLPFDTARDKIPEAIARISGFIKEEPQTRFDRGNLASFGDNGLEFEFVYYVLDPSYNTYMDIQQRVDLKMLEAFDELDIRPAVPARTLHIASVSPAAASPPAG